MAAVAATSAPAVVAVGITSFAWRRVRFDLMKKAFIVVIAAVALAGSYYLGVSRSNRPDGAASTGGEGGGRRGGGGGFLGGGGFGGGGGGFGGGGALGSW